MPGQAGRAGPRMQSVRAVRLDWLMFCLCQRRFRAEYLPPSDCQNELLSSNFRLYTYMVACLFAGLLKFTLGMRSQSKTLYPAFGNTLEFDVRFATLSVRLICLAAAHSVCHLQHNPPSKRATLYVFNGFIFSNVCFVNLEDELLFARSKPSARRV